MGRFDLTSVEGRLVLVDHIFVYPEVPHSRKHGPQGYENYESYREWIRDDFSYRCVFSLFRETWPDFSFHLDHLIPQKLCPDLVCSYENLIYLEGKLNLTKGKKHLPDPCKVNLRNCLQVHIKGERIGEIEALNPDGKRIIDTLRLDGPRATEVRRKILGILRSLARTDEALFRDLIGYPTELSDLSKKRGIVNVKPDGIKASAYCLQQKGTLSEWI